MCISVELNRLPTATINNNDQIHDFFVTIVLNFHYAYLESAISNTRALCKIDLLFCSDCVASALDLVFVVDGSGSICDVDPKFEYGRDITCDNWNFILTFMVDFVNDMDIGLTATRVGLVTFASTAVVQWDLKRYKRSTENFDL